MLEFRETPKQEPSFNGSHKLIRDIFRCWFPLAVSFFVYLDYFIFNTFLIVIPVTASIFFVSTMSFLSLLISIHTYRLFEEPLRFPVPIKTFRVQLDFVNIFIACAILYLAGWTAAFAMYFGVNFAILAAHILIFFKNR